MPLIGITDPSHKEAISPSDGTGPRWFTPEELLAIAKDPPKGPKWSDYNYELIHGILSEVQERDYISTTALLGCPRSTVLERKEPYVDQLKNLYPAFKGTMIHRLLEGSGRPGSLAECRFHTAVEGVPISCSPDLITSNGELWDYKNPALDSGVPNWYAWPSHTAQLHFNAYIVRHAKEVEGLYILEHGKTREARLTDIPPVKAVVIQYLGPKGPKPMLYERKKEMLITKGARAGETWEKNTADVWTDEEALKGLKIGNRFQPGLTELVSVMQEALESYPEIPDSAVKLWGGGKEWRCPGEPYCKLPSCTAKRYPHGLTWPKEGNKRGK